MKNQEKWKATKFIYNSGSQLVANKNYVGGSSILVANQMAGLYDKFLKYYANGVLLDLGCGTVPLYIVYQHHVEEVICIDWENSFHKNIHLDYTADLNDSIPLSNDSVDTILLSDVIEHISNYEKMFSEVARVIRKDGILILGVPFFYWLHEEPYDFHRYTRHQLELICKKNGFNVLDLQEFGGPLSVILDIIGKNLPRKLFPNAFHKFSTWFIGTDLGKKIDNRNKNLFPLGYCLVAKKK